MYLGLFEKKKEQLGYVGSWLRFSLLFFHISKWGIWLYPESTTPAKVRCVVNIDRNIVPYVVIPCNNFAFCVNVAVWSTLNCRNELLIFNFQILPLKTLCDLTFIFYFATSCSLLVKFLNMFYTWHYFQSIILQVACWSYWTFPLLIVYCPPHTGSCSLPLESIVWRYKWYRILPSYMSSSRVSFSIFHLFFKFFFMGVALRFYCLWCSIISSAACTCFDAWLCVIM